MGSDVLEKRGVGAAIGAAGVAAGGVVDCVAAEGGVGLVCTWGEWAGATVLLARFFFSWI